MNREAFKRENPSVFLLDPDNPTETAGRLQEIGWLKPGERLLKTRIAGEGNMNCTVRVSTTKRSLIVKQARPWVEKYSHIPAPWDRALVEGRFYQEVGSDPFLSSKMPRLLGLDTESRMLALEDLGDARDFVSIYAGERLTREETAELADFLSRLHRTFLNHPRLGEFANREMRALNHQHIFSIPFAAGNGLDLDAITPGLGELAEHCRQDTELKTVATRLGELYLKDGSTLLHGDYFPGSWLKTDDGIRIIDPEFSFPGPPEFDIGIMAAHLHLARQPDRIGDLVDTYEPAPGFAPDLAARFAGIEIVRRLIGVAQLPLNADLDTKLQLLQTSRRLAVAGAW